MTAIVCMGELIMDMFSADTGLSMAEVRAFLPTPGGAAANVAVQIARCGVGCAFVGKVGDDAFGRRLAATLGDAGVEISSIRFDAHARTTTNFIALPTANSAEFLFFRNPGADMLLRTDELDFSLIEQARVFYFGSLGIIEEPLRAATLAAVNAARTAGSTIVFDANYRAPLWASPAHAVKAIRAILPLVDILKVNAAELALLTEERLTLDAAARQLLSLGPTLVVTTLGADGCHAATAKLSLEVAGFAVNTVDASGCGDAFVGGLIAQLLQTAHGGQDLTAPTLQQALLFANAAAALTATRRGVIPALPTTAAVHDFLDPFTHTHVR